MEAKRRYSIATVSDARKVSNRNYAALLGVDAPAVPMAASTDMVSPTSLLPKVSSFASLAPSLPNLTSSSSGCQPLSQRPATPATSAAPAAPALRSVSLGSSVPELKVSAGNVREVRVLGADNPIIKARRASFSGTPGTGLAGPSAQTEQTGVPEGVPTLQASSSQPLQSQSLPNSPLSTNEPIVRPRRASCAGTGLAAFAVPSMSREAYLSTLEPTARARRASFSGIGFAVATQGVQDAALPKLEASSGEKRPLRVPDVASLPSLSAQRSMPNIAPLQLAEDIALAAERLKSPQIPQSHS